jgi:hypothetical protein
MMPVKYVQERRRRIPRYVRAEVQKYKSTHIDLYKEYILQYLFTEYGALHKLS